MNTSAAPTTVHAMVTRHGVGTRAEAAALVHGSRTITYRELDEMSVRVRAELSRRGIGPGDFVGVRMRRSPEAIAALIGVMRCGAAYVPVDDNDPAERVRHVVSTADMPLIVTDELAADAESAVPLLPLGTGCHPVGGTPVADGLEAEPPVPPSSAAYAMFTSGSTGLPKGAVMPHSALVNMLSWHQRTRPGSCTLRTAQVCALSFDFSFHEVFSTLAFGGTLVLTDDETSRNPFSLSEFIEARGIERLFLPVTQLEHVAQVIERVGGRPPRLLREVITTGERLHITPAIRGLFRDGRKRLHNHYGATEFQDAATHTLDGDPDQWPDISPIGRTIDGVDVRVVDSGLREVADGEEGELCVLGAGLSHGYLGQPSLTAERFVRAPGSDERLYRTGDLARVRDDGAIEVLGRIDAQVKIGGVRIEVGEIESHLVRHPDVGEAAVIAHEVEGHQRLVAHVVPARGEDAPAPQDLHKYLGTRVPAIMLPEAYRFHPSMPLTSSGKTDRGRLRPPRTFDRLSASEVVDPGSSTERVLVETWKRVLNVEAVSVEDSFFDLGGTSRLLVEVQRQLSHRLGDDLPMVDLLRFPTIASFAAHIDRSGRESAEPVGSTRGPDRVGPRDEGGDIAIIGMAGRFPGAPDVERFWRNLLDGTESVEPLTGVESAQPDTYLTEQDDYVRMGATLPGIDRFDAEFFGLTAREAETMDPQHRLFLECAWEALEDAGHMPGVGSDPDISVFGGTGISTYLVNNLAPNFRYGQGKVFTESDIEQFQVKIGNDPSYLATRVSHALGLRGPSVSVQTACSTSLVAVHMACRSLLEGSSEIALAGGVRIAVPQNSGYLFQEGMVLSRDGRTRTFDSDASGTMFGNGAGVVALKRLDDALRDRYRVIAVIRGSAVNNDGRKGKISFTAPSFRRQSDVISDALREAGVDAATIGYVEAHGTGTALGDPIEVSALTDAFERNRNGESEQHGDQHTGSCAIGSVKTNIGHLDEAAGIAGLIKAALCVERGMLVPSLHYGEPNPNIDFASSPFHVSTRTEPWHGTDTPRRAGVTALGIGGTNCHVVLEEPPRQEPADEETPAAREHLLLLSGRTPEATEELRERYIELLSAPPRAPFADLCFTSAVGRRHFPHRVAVVAASAEEARDQLRELGRYRAPAPTRGPASTAYLFPGQGPQHPDMGRELYERSPVFREIIDECDRIVRDRLGFSLTEVLFGEAGEHSPLSETLHAQPSLFSFEYALARTWQAWGVAPDVLLGHSLGEYAAACLAGVFSLEDALTMVCERGRLTQSLPESGVMVAVAAGESVVSEFLGSHTSIAAVNGPSSTVISGRTSEIEEVCAQLRSRGVRLRPLDVSFGSHSPLVRPMAEDFAEVARAISYHEPSIPIISTLTGKPARAEIADWRYWVRQITQPVLFSDAVTALEEKGATVLLEVSPKPTLLPLAEELLTPDGVTLVQSTRPERQWGQMLEAVGDLHTSGADIDWRALHAGAERSRAALPTNPWQRERYWIDPPVRRPGPRDAASETPLLGGRLDLAGDGGVRFDATLGTGRLAWLGDHRVFRTIVMPGVAYQEMALAAGRSVFGPSTVFELRDFHIHRAMAFPTAEHERQVQVVLAPEGHEAYSFEVHSRPALPEDGGTAGAPPRPWTLHASGALASDRTATAHEYREPPDSLLRGFDGNETDPERIYQQELEREIDLGPAFRVTRRLWRNGLATLSEIALPEETHRDAAEHQIHPVMLEACFLALTLAYPERLGRRTYVPVGADTVRLEGEVGTAAWCRTRMRPPNGDAPETLHADVELFAADGTRVLTMSGVLLRHADKESMIPHGDGLEWIYRSSWEPAEPPKERGAPGRWLVLSDGGLGPALAAKARAEGITCDLESVDGPPPFQEDGDQESNTRRLVDYDLVVAAWSDRRSVEDQGRDAIEQSARLLRLVQRLSTAEGTAPRLYLVTCGAQPVAGDHVTSPAQAALWGMGRVFRAEAPELACTQVDLDPAEGVDEHVSLLCEELGFVWSPHTSHQIGYRRGRRYGAVLHRESLPGPGDADGTVRPDATYVITGGHGDLGLETAEALAGAGARHLVLIGRRPPSPEAAERGSALRDTGVSVESFAADVSDLSALSEVFDAIRANRDLPPLGGVLHLAGALDDGTILMQTKRRLTGVMAPKVLGAWNLRLLTQNDPLDFFALFSSSSGLLGTPGQANYAAANTFLDGFASFVRGSGTPAVAVQWGSWAEVGMSARAGLDAKLADSGEGTLPRSVGRSLLTRLLARGRQGDATVAVLPIEWELFPPRNSEALTDFLRHMPGRSVPTEDSPSDRFLDAFRDARGERRRQLLVEHLQGQVRGLLGHRSEVAPEADFFALGVDSLTAVELRRNLRTSLGHAVSQSAVFEYPNARSLADHITSALEGDESS